MKGEIKMSEENKTMDEKFREELVASVKALGKTVVENAEDFVGNDKFITDINILLNFPLGEIPEITITRSHSSKEYIKMATKK